MKILVFTATYNESKNIEKLINKIFSLKINIPVKIRVKAPRTKTICMVESVLPASFTNTVIKQKHEALSII